MNNEESDTIVNSNALDHADAQALALRCELDDLLPAQSLASGDGVRAVVLDPETGFGPELSLLEYSALSGWRGATVYLPANDRAGLAAAAAWLLARCRPLS